MTDPLHSPLAITAAILEHHGQRFPGFAPQPYHPMPSRDPVFKGARAACHQLGFAAVDAEVLASAWSARFARTGELSPETWPTAPEDFGLQAMPRGHGFAPCPARLGLYAVLPDADWVGRMAHAGVPTVQLRFKSDDPGAVRAQVRAAVQAVQGTEARLFINDHWQEALQAGAYGIHLGQEDLDALPPSEIEGMRSTGVRLGVSTHGYAEMLRADEVGPSYIALGAVFPTTLKRMATPPQGVPRLTQYAQLMQHYPLVAIGGIDEDRFAEILATGVGSIAVVRALVAAKDPEQTAQRLLRLMSTALPSA